MTKVLKVLGGLCLAAMLGYVLLGLANERGPTVDVTSVYVLDVQNAQESVLPQPGIPVTTTDQNQAGTYDSAGLFSLIGEPSVMSMDTGAANAPYAQVLGSETVVSNTSPSGAVNDLTSGTNYMMGAGVFSLIQTAIQQNDIAETGDIFPGLGYVSSLQERSAVADIVGNTGFITSIVDIKAISVNGQFSYVFAVVGDAGSNIWAVIAWLPDKFATWVVVLMVSLTAYAFMLGWVTTPEGKGWISKRFGAPMMLERAYAFST